MAGRFYLDENLPHRLAARLDELGHDAVSTDQLGNKGTRDHRQLLLAAHVARILVTYNAGDFRLLHDAWRDWSQAWGATAQARHTGILIIQQEHGLTLVLLAQVIADLVARVEGFGNRLFAWNRRQGWHEIV